MCVRVCVSVCVRVYMCVCVHACEGEGHTAGLTPTFLSKSPTMFKAVIRVDGVNVLGLPPSVLVDDAFSTEGVDVEAPV